MANSLSVNVSNRTQKLVRVELDNQSWDHLLNLEVLLHHAVGRVWDVVHHHVQVNFVLRVTLRVEGAAESHHVWMEKLLHDWQLSVLVALVLVNLFDSHSFTSLNYRRLEHNSKGAVADNAVCRVGEASLQSQERRLTGFCFLSRRGSWSTNYEECSLVSIAI